MIHLHGQQDAVDYSCSDNVAVGCAGKVRSPDYESGRPLTVEGWTCLAAGSLRVRHGPIGDAGVDIVMPPCDERIRIDAARL